MARSLSANRQTRISYPGLNFTSAGFGGNAVNIPNNSAIQGLTTFSLELRFKVTGYINIRDYLFYYMVGNLGFYAGINLAGTLTCQVGNGTTTASLTTSAVNLNTYHHLELNWDGSKLRCFIDGVLQTSQPALSGGNTGNPNINAYIGNINTTNRSFYGVITGVRLSNIVRHTSSFTPPTASPTKDANTIGLYLLNEGSGTTARDTSGNGNNGTLVGNPLPVWYPVPPVRNVKPPANAALSFGANTHSSAAQSLYADMVSANLGWARIELSWSAVEGTQGTYNWTFFDTVVAAATAAGAQCLLLLNKPPAWALSGSTLQSQYYPNFVNFAVAALNHFASSGVVAYEVFNEVNGSLNYVTFGSSAANYATLLQSTYTAMKAANPACIILHSGLAANQSSAQYSRTFLNAVYSAIGSGYFDVMNFHPYGTSSNSWWNQSEITDIYNNAMSINGDASKKMWLTEYGNYNGTAAGAVDVATQANLARQAIRNVRHLSYIDKLFFYDYVDDADDITVSQDNYGLTYVTGLHKPVWLSVRDTIAYG